MIESEDIRYEFDEALDRAFLDQMYGGDVSYTIQIFDIFLSQTLLELEQLRSAIRDQDRKRTFQLVHKIKPTFDMVGLTSTRSILAEIEANAGEQVNFQKIKSLIVEVNEHVDRFIPIIQAEIKKMRAYI